MSNFAGIPSVNTSGWGSYELQGVGSYELQGLGVSDSDMFPALPAGTQTFVNVRGKSAAWNQAYFDCRRKTVPAAPAQIRSERAAFMAPFLSACAAKADATSRNMDVPGVGSVSDTTLYIGAGAVVLLVLGGVYWATK